jgi:alanyl-tRNA synthetase
MRIIADHIKASVFIILDGINPSNTEQGYILRRLIRRAIRYGRELGMNNFTEKVAEEVFEIYSDYEILKDKKRIIEGLKKEEEKFLKTLEEGIKVAEKILSKKIPIEKDKYIKLMQLEDKGQILKGILQNKKEGKPHNLPEIGISEKEIDEAAISGDDEFLLYQSYGFPIEMIYELAREKHLIADKYSFLEAQEKHQELSSTASAGMFKSGLADNSEKTTRLHTATHLLAQALRVVLNKPELHQKGSNINAERARFDFTFDRKLTEEEIKKVEEIVNENISKKIEVKCETMSPEEAKKKGFQGIFDSKYGEKITAYSVGDFSKEICAGPHVKNTKELGKFKIIGQESVGAGTRRIKAILE